MNKYFFRAPQGKFFTFFPEFFHFPQRIKV